MDEKEIMKQYLLNKYKKAFDLSEHKKYAVYRKNIGSTNLMDSELVCNCDTLEEAQAEIAWRAEYHATNNKDVAINNDKQFDTFYDSSESGKLAKDFVYIPMDYEGEYWIQEFYSVKS